MLEKYKDVRYACTWRTLLLSSGSAKGEMFVRARLYHRYLNLPILSKLLLWTVISALFSAMVVLCIAFNFSSRDMHEKSLSSTQDLLLYVNAMVQSEQQYLYGVAAYYAGNSEVQSMMLTSNDETAVSEELISNDLFKVSLSGMHILSLSFYNRNGKNNVF